ncbi:hypothetical protein LCGC14_0423540 [marine sediment metagenome]|uniref:ERCC4 domain-containing protein n=1 Tax=marine sediment metagenome TaxID=412755 RepID=A0A0F9VC92_9ZZZZ
MDQSQSPQPQLKSPSQRHNLGIDSREPIGQQVVGEKKPRQDIRPLLDAYDGVSYDVVTYTAGDYLLWDDQDVTHFVTRKASDLADSLMSGHFSDEIQKILTDPLFVRERSISERRVDGSSPRPSRIFFIVEGAWAGAEHKVSYMKRVSSTFMKATWTTNVHIDSLSHAQISASTAGIEILHTADLRGTASILAALVDRARRGWPTRIGHQIRRVQPEARNVYPPVARLLQLWPRLSEKAAVALIAEYGTLGAVIEAALSGHADDIAKGGFGVGAKGLVNFKEVLNE